MPEDTIRQRLAARSADAREAINYGSNDEVYDALVDLTSVVEEFLADEPPDDTMRRVYALDNAPDGDLLEVKLTDEGVIIDAFADADHLGTHAMTADKWFESILWRGIVEQEQ